MEKAGVTCPNCGKDFEVNVNATRGKCPYCKISLVFENAVVKRKSPTTGKEPIESQSETRIQKGISGVNVDISRIENAVDGLVGAAVSNPKKISDVAVIESIELESDYLPLEKKVDKILKAIG